MVFALAWLMFSLMQFSDILSTLVSDLHNDPNIVFIMADDLGYGDLGCYGATKIRTPNIDRLANSGIKLLDAHSPASVCTPTRYGVLTGRYCWRGSLKKEVLWSGYERCLIEPGRKTIGHMMKESGYATAQIGKWHLGWEDREPVDYQKENLGRGPKELGFDYSFVTACAHNLSPIVFVENHKIRSDIIPLDYNIYFPNYGKPMPENQKKWHDTHDLGPMMIAEDWQPDLVDKIYTERTTEFIEKHVAANPGRPFYVHLTPEAPHRPNNVPDFLKHTSAAGRRGDHIQMLDWMVGQIMSVLNKLAVAENTLVILTSDNGPRPVGFDGYKDGKLVTDFGHKSAGDLRGFKSSNWEGGHRVPFVACWPGRIKPGTVSDQLLCLTDMMATFAGIADYPIEEGMAEDSFDALPILLTGSIGNRKTIITQEFNGGLAIREGPWKLLGDRLFNLEKDQGEKRDISGSHPDIVQQLQKLLQEQIEDGRTRVELRK